MARPKAKVKRAKEGTEIKNGVKGESDSDLIKRSSGRKRWRKLCR